MRFATWFSVALERCPDELACLLLTRKTKGRHVVKKMETLKPENMFLQ